MWRKLSQLFLVLLAAMTLSVAAKANVFDMTGNLTSLELVTVGNACNMSNAWGGNGNGEVDYEYQIGKYEVTAGQYCEFLNAVAATDTYGLYNTKMRYIEDSYTCNIIRNGTPGSYTYNVAESWANRPVNYVSWDDAARFCNWLHNGQPTGSQNFTTTEDGAYYLNGAVSNATLSNVTRKEGAHFYIPSVDEWFKAAYHKNDGLTGNYFNYPTSSDSVPSNDLLNPDPGNNANFYQNGSTIGSPYYATKVGEFENSESPYGTFDQGGNVGEWCDAEVVNGGGWLPDYTSFCLLGGDFNFVSSLMTSSPLNGLDADPTDADSTFGFRVASIFSPTATPTAMAK